jgi:hypothetical protein
MPAPPPTPLTATLSLQQQPGSAASSDNQTGHALRKSAADLPGVLSGVVGVAAERRMG